MKKIYMIPTMKVVEIKAVRILAGSPNPNFDPNSNTSTMGARSSRFSRWEEDDYEE